MLIRKRWTVQSTVTVAQPITPWLSLRSLYRLDKAEIKAKRASFSIEARQIRAKVQGAFYNCLKADSYFAVINDAEKMIKEQEKRVRALLKAKLVTEAELAKVLSARADIRAQKIKVIASSLLSRQYLAYLLGIKLNTRIKVIRPKSAGQKVPSLMACTRLATQKRPTFALISLKKEQLRHARAALNFSRLPTLMAVAQYKNSQGFGELEPEHQLFVGLTFSWQFSWMNKKREQDKLSVKQRQLTLTRRKALRGISLEIRKAHLEMLAARALIAARKEAVEAAKKAYEKLDLQLSLKYTTNSDLLTARTELTKAKVNLLNAQNAYALAKNTYRDTCR